MFLLESVHCRSKEYLIAIYTQINKCASNLRQRLLHFHETVSGLLDLWPASPCKAILHPGTAVELAQFHSYDLSLTDVKECKIHTFSHTAWKKKTFEAYRTSDVCISADRYTLFDLAYDFTEHVSFHSQGKWCSLGEKKEPKTLPCFCTLPPFQLLNQLTDLHKTLYESLPSDFIPTLYFNLPKIRNSIVAVQLELINSVSWYDYFDRCQNTLNFIDSAHYEYKTTHIYIPA